MKEKNTQHKINFGTRKWMTGQQANKTSNSDLARILSGLGGADIDKLIEQRNSLDDHT